MEHLRTTARKRWNAFPSKSAEYIRQKRRKLKMETITAYGGQCICCGESVADFLTIDHTNGGGTQKRKNGEPLGFVLYYKLKRLGWPKDEYQLMCFNCNFGRAIHGGICPHKTVDPFQD